MAAARLTVPPASAASTPFWTVPVAPTFTVVAVPFKVLPGFSVMA